MSREGFDTRMMVQLLVKNGYRKVRSNGSHFTYRNDKGNTITITKKLNRMVAMRLIKENALKIFK